MGLRARIALALLGISISTTACGVLIGVGDLVKVGDGTGSGDDGGGSIIDPDAGPGTGGVTDAGFTVSPDGGAVATCPGETALCGTACVDLAHDPANCGQCGTACSSVAGAVCASGACSTSFYIAPDGADDVAGGTITAPWKTFAFAIPRLTSGATLIVRDGTYTRATTGLPNIDCVTFGAPNGTAAAPVTIRAEHERRATLVSDGASAALAITSCAYWSVEGLVGKSADLDAAHGGKAAAVFDFYQSSHITARKLVAAFPNRNFKRETIALSECTSSLLEDSEIYSYHQYGVFVYAGADNVLRRVYANSRSYPDLPSLATRDVTRGDDGIILSDETKHTIVENCIGENNKEDFYAGANPNDGTPQQILGSIAIDDFTGFGTSSRGWNTTYKDIVSLRVESDGLYLDNVTNTLVQGATFFAGKGGGVYMDNTTANPTQSAFVTNALSLSDSTNTGFSSSGGQNLNIESSNAFGNATNYDFTEKFDDDAGHLQRCTSVAATAIGISTNQCLVYVPAASSMKGAGKSGADIGANIVFRYENGVLTNKKLWDATTGKFPCGAAVPGLTDVVGKSCTDVNERLNVGVKGCASP